MISSRIGLKQSFGLFTVVLVLFDVFVLVREERGHVGGAAVGAIVGGVVGRTALLVLLVLLLEFLRQDVQLFY